MEEMHMAKIAVIRLRGRFSNSPTMENSLSSLRLNRLYACTVVDDSASAKGMIQGCKDGISFGAVEKETVALLLARRGKTLGGKKLSAAAKPEEIRKILDGFLAGKKLTDLGVCPVFYLTPPKGGFGHRKTHTPFGPIGKNPEIAGLISRMA